MKFSAILSLTTLLTISSAVPTTSEPRSADPNAQLPELPELPELPDLPVDLPIDLPTGTKAKRQDLPSLLELLNLADLSIPLGEPLSELDLSKLYNILDQFVGAPAGAPLPSKE